MNAAMLWTGTITFDLLHASARPAWRLDVVIGRELVTLWRGQHNIAMIDRDQLRAWITTDAAVESPPLERHDVALTSIQAWIAVAVAVYDEPPAWLTPADVLRLGAVI